MSTVYDDFEPVNDKEIDLSVIYKFFIRNKFLISGISFIFFVVSCLYALTLRKVWQGEFQIVLTNKQSQEFSLINPCLKSLLGNSTKNDLQTQVGILESPSVLMPVFEFVRSEKKSINKNNDINFAKWKKNLNIELENNTSILNVEYRDIKNELILQY